MDATPKAEQFQSLHEEIDLLQSTKVLTSGKLSLVGDARDDHVTQKVSAALQLALSDCFNHRMKIVLFLLKKKDRADPSTRDESRKVIIESARAILDHKRKLDTMLEGLPEVASNAWAHFIHSLLHCHVFYALMNWLLSILQQTQFDDDVQARHKRPIPLDVDDALQFLDGITASINRCSILSLSSIKQCFITNAIVCGVQECLRLGIAPGLKTMYSHTAEGRSIVRAIQQSMEQTTEMIRTNIKRAQMSDDPLPGLMHKLDGGWTVDEQTHRFPSGVQAPSSERLSSIADLEWANVLVSCSHDN
jgi:hypothetical protein